MATITRTLLPLKRYTNINQTTAAIDVPNRVVSATLRVTGTEYTDPATHIDLTLEESDDGGATWQFAAGFTSDGGAKDRNGQPVNPSMTIDFTDDQRTSASFRATLTVVGSIRFGIDAEIETV